MVRARMHTRTLMVLTAAIVVVVGVLLAYAAWTSAPPGDPSARSRAGILLAATIVCAGLFMISATSRLWFGGGRGAHHR
jgi:ABC-type spermidine/putrescine transport system permease subunit II